MGNCLSLIRRKIWKPAAVDKDPTAMGALINKPEAERPHKPIPVNVTNIIRPVNPEGIDDNPDAFMFKSIDFCLSDNGKRHFTHEYECMERKDSPYLVVRRGQNFQVVVTFSRPYDEKTDAITLHFTLQGAVNPTVGHGTIGVAPVRSEMLRSDKDWTAEVESSKGNDVTINICSPAEAIIGRWKLDVDTRVTKEGSKPISLSMSVESPITVIFNPWCADDPVFLNDEGGRKEYVLADSGLIWRGSYYLNQPTVWEYDQFEKDILDCSIEILTTVGRLSYPSLSDPIKVSRAISAAVNSPDDNGIVWGNWSGKYEGGKIPTAWNSSRDILQEYYRTKSPVKFGQCWVFAGVVTTVCRALGLPCRPVTNFDSAHDTQMSLTIDVFTDQDGKEVDALNSDSIWNFHVWNEAWMKRPDIGAGHDGWQVIDATPQEASDGTYCCGPTSVVAVKMGEIKRPYDVGFVFSEVNADKVFWLYNGEGQPLKFLSRLQSGIGRGICTKSIGDYSKQDLTLSYKYPENSEKERSTMLNALRQAHHMFTRYYLNAEFEDVFFDFQSRDDIVVGEYFTVAVVMKNKSKKENYTVSVILKVDSIRYTGARENEIRRERFEVKLAPYKEEKIEMRVEYDQYHGLLSDQATFNIACLAKVHESDFDYYAADRFRVRKPDIKITTQGECVVGERFFGTVTLKNPLPVPLHNAHFEVSGAGLGDKQVIRIRREINPKEEFQEKFSLTPRLSGDKVIVASFESAELDDVDGYLNIKVLPHDGLEEIAV